MFIPRLTLPNIPAVVIAGQDNVIKALCKLSEDYGKVVVFAAGNSTMIAPSVEGMMPRYVPSLTNLDKRGLP